MPPYDLASMTTVQAERLLNAPIITPETHASIGSNIQGPSLIRVPDWIVGPLGKYYLYFADHKGEYIRLVYADDIDGPWRVHPPRSLRLSQSHFATVRPDATPDAVTEARARVEQAGIRLPHDLVSELTTPHIASPDVHVDQCGRGIVMYFHGLESFGRQVTRAATSADGIHFAARPEVLGKTYLRAFRHDGWTYAMAMPGQFYRSADGMTAFEAGRRLFDDSMRHAALLVRERSLYVFWTRVGDAPERIMVSTIDLSRPRQDWVASAPDEARRPERDREGADLPIEPSIRSNAYKTDEPVERPGDL